MKSRNRKPLNQSKRFIKNLSEVFLNNDHFMTLEEIHEKLGFQGKCKQSIRVVSQFLALDGDKIVEYCGSDLLKIKHNGKVMYCLEKYINTYSRKMKITKTKEVVAFERITDDRDYDYKKKKEREKSHKEIREKTKIANT